MKRFGRDIAEAEQAAKREVAAIREKLGIAAEYQETTDVERFSLAVQVFATMTVEAAISCHTVVRFGGEHYDDHFRWGSPASRLKKSLEHAGIPIGEDDEVLQLIRRLADTRNQIVHPHTQEIHDEAPGQPRMPGRGYPEMTAAAAQRAMQDVDRFLLLLRQLDPSASGFFVE
jgi:hypothetical protein